MFANNGGYNLAIPTIFDENSRKFAGQSLGLIKKNYVFPVTNDPPKIGSVGL